MTDPADDERDRVLAAMLPAIVFDGWSMKALKGAAAGLDSEALAALFPAGAASARQWLDDWADRRMLAGLAAQDLDALRLSQRVALALELRLAALAPHREAVRLALAARFAPSEWPAASTALYRTVDRIWRAVGDRSVDFSYYTKRASLAGIHAASLLYWLNDGSEDAIDTRDFIARRLRDAARLPSARQRTERLLKPLTGPLDLLRRGAAR